MTKPFCQTKNSPKSQQNRDFARSVWSAGVFRRFWLGKRRGSRQQRSARKDSGGIRAHCYEFCQAAPGVFPVFVFLFIKSFFSCCLPFCPGPKVETFSWRLQWASHCSTCYPCTAPMGTAPVDSFGHSQETDAPNLQSGLLPAPVRLRARAVSNCFGRSWF